MKTLTTDLLKDFYYENGSSVSKTQEYAFSFISIIRPEKPKAPISKFFSGSNKLTPAELRDMADQMEQHEKDMKVYKAADKVYSVAHSEIHSIFVDFIKDVAGLNEIPEQYREKVYQKAYDYGHSSGYSEVLCYLQDLVEIFD